MEDKPQSDKRFHFNMKDVIILITYVITICGIYYNMKIEMTKLDFRITQFEKKQEDTNGKFNKIDTKLDILSDHMFNIKLEVQKIQQSK